MASKQPSETTAAEAAYAKAAEAVTQPAAAPAPVAEAAKAPVAAKVEPKAEAKPVARKAAKPTRSVKAAAKPVAPKKTAAKKTTRVAAPISAKARKTISKDKTMTAKKTNTANFSGDFAKGFQTVVADAQTKAKEAFEKGSAQLSEANEFAKGNVEALVESGKILAAGLQQIATGATAEAKTAFETMTADVKELSTAKTPADFLRLQSDIMRRNFDAMMAFGSKNSETAMKLASDTFAPISTRVNLAVEKVRKAA